MLLLRMCILSIVRARTLRYSSVILALNVSIVLRQRLHRLYTLRCRSVIIA